MLELDRRLSDPNISSSGFLANNETFSQVYTRDLTTLRKYGITCEQIADRLETLTNKYRRKEELLLSNKIQILPQEQTILNTTLIPHPFPHQPGNYSAAEIHGLIIENHYIIAKAGLGIQYCPFKIKETQGNIESCGGELEIIWSMTY